MQSPLSRIVNAFSSDTVAACALQKMRNRYQGLLKSASRDRWSICPEIGFPRPPEGEEKDMLSAHTDRFIKPSTEDMTKDNTSIPFSDAEREAKSK